MDILLKAGKNRAIQENACTKIGKAAQAKGVSVEVALLGYAPFFFIADRPAAVFSSPGNP